MLYKLFYIILLTAIFTLTLISAENEDTDFKNLKVESLSFERGISHQTVYDIHKDSKGFLWFGTMYGLVHYMGSEIKVYRHDPEDPSTLSNDDVTKIFEDSKGRFWIATFGGGFNLLDLKRDKIKRYTPARLNLQDEWNGITWAFTEDDEGNIFVATDNYGILKLDPIDDSFEHYPLIFDEKPILHDKKFSQDHEGNIYLISLAKKLRKYDKSLNKFVVFDFPNTELRSIRDINKGRNNNLWICSSSGVIRYNQKTNEYTNFSKIFTQLSEPRYIRISFIDSQNRVWLGGYNKLFLLDSSHSKVYTFSSKEEGEKQIHSGSVVGITEDNNGMIWSGHYQGGINKIFKDDPVFSAVNYNPDSQNSIAGNKVNDFMKLDGGELAVATSNGLTIYNRETNEVKNYFEGLAIYTLLAGPNNNIWLGTSNGILKVNRGFKILHRMFYDSKDTTTITGGPVISSLLDQANNIWMGTTNGLNRIDPLTNRVTRYIDNLSINDDISGETVLSLYQDNSGFIYAGTYNGLNKFDPITGKFTCFKHNPDDPSTIASNYVFAYHEDAEGNLWLGTGGGLSKYDRSSDSFSTWTEKDGLSNSVIYGIIEVQEHLFLSTAEGISVIDLSNGNVNRFYKSHGLHGNMFGSRAHLYSNDGTIIFGGLNGFTKIDIDGYFSRSIDPEVRIVSVSDIETTFENNLPYKSTDEVTIPYHSNYIRFNFTSLDYKHPDNNSFNYRLEGLDTTWMNTDGKSFVQYPAIPPGDYDLIVKAVNSTGFEGNKQASLSIKVPPPFWQTIWFYSLVLISIAAIGYTVHRSRIRAEVKRAKELENIREEEETKLRKKAADDFHDELGHRITKISLYSELLKRAITDQESGSVEYIRKISEISSGLSSGVKDFIWTLDPGKDTLYDVAIRLKDFGDDLFDKSGISFRTSGIKENFNEHLMPMDWRRHIILIFKEAMNNILKYSNAENVLLGFEFENNEIDISLKDDGTGFDIETVNKGRGLKNIRMRAASVKGQIDIQSTKENGTSIRLHSAIPQ